MGNKLCKKKTDNVPDNNSKTASPFDRIVNRLHLRPNKWKSDSQLNKKQANSEAIIAQKNNKNSKNLILSKSSDWTDAALEVPEKDDDDDAIHLRNPKLSLIFNNDGDETPKPPPRSKQKKNLREKLESVAKSGFQVFQTKKPVDEPLFIKKTINATCPVCDHDCTIHNKDHKHEKQKEINNKTLINNTPKLNLKLSDKDAKRRKNLSIISLPNYNELKLTVAKFDDSMDKPDVNGKSTSIASLPNETKKLKMTASTGKLEIYMERCRSFGSLLPHQLLDKLRARKCDKDKGSDESFGALEDWDVGIIEHYNPKDASLPRPRKIVKDNSNDATIIADIESLILKEEEIPVAPVRKSESLVKKINKEGSESAIKRRSQDVLNKLSQSDTITPPPSPEGKPLNGNEHKAVNVKIEDSKGPSEHSTLMKILQEYSVKDIQQQQQQQQQQEKEESTNSSDFSSLSPSLLEFEKNLAVSSIEEFINAEKLNNVKQYHPNFNHKMTKT